MPSILQSALWLGALVSSVASHGMVTKWTADGKAQQGFILDYYYAKVNGQPVPSIASWYTENLDSGFVAPDAYGTADINCHKNASPGKTYATVAAGGSLSFSWAPAPWVHPYGPVLTYVAKCSGECTSADKSSLRWVKIEESGINYSTQKWASQVLVDNGSVWTTKVPAGLAPGNYVFRHELIALHGAGSVNGAQNYPQCFNVKVTGSGTKTLPAGVPGTALYKATDPGIHMNPYTTITSYAMPGPTLWTG